MTNEPTQRSESTSRWTKFSMVVGLACILVGIVITSLAQGRSELIGVANAIGYLGLALVLVFFFIQITVD